MEDIQVAQSLDLLQFFKDNKQHLGLVAFVLPLAARFVSQKSWVKLAILILETARRLAAAELAEESRRDSFKTEVYKLLPWWLTKFVTKPAMDQLLDMLYAMVLAKPLPVSE